MNRSSPMLHVIAFVASLVAGVATASEPTALEAFVAKPNVVVEFSQAVGSIRSSDATVEVTAIVASDTADATQRMRGVRLYLQNNAGIDQLYLDESQLAKVQGELAEIEGGIAYLKSGTDAPWRAQGTGSCWMPERPQRILCPGYVVGPEGSRMTLGAYGANAFEFPGHRPSELAALIASAVAAFPAH